MKKTVILPILILFLAAVITPAQESLLDRVREKYNSASTISADITQLSGSLKLSGKIYLKKQNKIRADFKNISIISDGTTFWNYNKKENKVIINRYDENDPSAFSFVRIMNEYPEKSNVTVEKDNGEDVLILIPKKESGLNFSSVRLWITGENLIRKARLEQGGNITDITVSNYQFDKDIPDSRFSFSPPAGAQVIDLR